MSELLQRLQAMRATMDLVERSGIAPEDLEKFRETRKKDYALLIAREVRVGENICTETLDAVTAREVTAGRMSPDNPLRQGAIAAMAAPHLSRAELTQLSQLEGLIGLEGA